MSILAAYDPSQLSDAQIEATPEFRAFMGSLPTSQAPAPFTVATARLACRLAVPALRAGTPVKWPTDSGIYFRKAHEQLATARKAEHLDGKLDWTIQAPPLRNTEFGRWLLDGAKKPDTSTGKMNCWEFVLFSACEAGFTTPNRLRRLYAQFASGSTSSLFISSEAFKKAIQGGPDQIYVPDDPSSPRPIAGDVVIFPVFAAHVAIATGNYPGKKVEVMSLGDQNSGRVFRTTLEDLGGLKRYPFFHPKW